MSSLLLILLSAVLVCHYALTVPALKPFVEADSFSSATGVAVATAITLILVAPLSYVLDHLVLIPLDLSHLRTLALVIVIMAVAPLTAVALRLSGRWMPIPRAFVILMTSNCAVLGVALLTTMRARSFGDALLFSLGTGSAFAVMLLMFTAMQQRLRHAAVPLFFRNAPAALITIGLMALAFMGFSGLIRE